MPKPRPLGADLRASTLERQAPALALMGCVTLDKSTPFTGVWNQRTVQRHSHLLFQLDFIFARPAQLLGSPGTSPMWTLDWERAGSSEMASGWPQHWNLALLYVNILGALDLAKHFTVRSRGQSACLGLRVRTCPCRGLSLCTGLRGPLLRAPLAGQERGEPWQELEGSRACGEDEQDNPLPHPV